MNNYSGAYQAQPSVTGSRMSRLNGLEGSHAKARDRLEQSFKSQSQSQYTVNDRDDNQSNANISVNNISLNNAANAKQHGHNIEQQLRVDHRRTASEFTMPVISE